MLTALSSIIGLGLLEVEVSLFLITSGYFKATYVLFIGSVIGIVAKF
jgi:hypothetical protein